MLVDDAAGVRRELRQLLELSGEIQVVAEAGNGLEALRLLPGSAPDVVIMDLEMPVLDGLEATLRIKAGSPAPRVVILSVHSGAEVERRVQIAGADAFVIKGADFQSLLIAIRGMDGSINSQKGE